MTPYAHDPRLRARQVAGDLLLLLWIALWLRVGLALYDAVLRLQGPGRGLEDAGGSLAGGLGGAADKAGGVPVVGGGLRAPLEAAARAGQALASAGVEQQQVVGRLALLLGLLVAVLPVAWALAHRVPGRWRWWRQARAADSLRGDVDLLALRAATTAPLSQLARLGPEPVGRWRRGEPGAAQELAELELRRLGLRGRPAGGGGG